MILEKFPCPSSSPFYEEGDECTIEIEDGHLFCRAPDSRLCYWEAPGWGPQWCGDGFCIDLKSKDWKERMKEEKLERFISDVEEYLKEYCK